jgi:hypothetical protein
MNITIQNGDDNYQEIFARSIVARLNDSSEKLPHDISERLKAARMQALGKRKLVNVKVASGVSVNGNAAALQFDGEHRRLWSWLAAAVPLIVLVGGLFAIDVVQDGFGTMELAEVDAEILTDDLPPAAYTDPGFLRFLSVKRQE